MVMVTVTGMATGMTKKKKNNNNMIETFLDRYYDHPTMNKLINYFSNNEFKSPS